MPKERARAAARHWMLQRQQQRNAGGEIFVVFYSLVDELGADLVDIMGDLLITPMLLSVEEYLKYREEGGIIYV